MSQKSARREFLKSVGRGGVLGLAGWGVFQGWGLSQAYGQEVCPQPFSREDLVHLFEGPWRGLRAVIEKKVIDFHAHTHKKPGPGAKISVEQANEEIRLGLRSPASHPEGWVPSAGELISSMNTHGIRYACVLTSKAANYEQELKELAKYPGRVFFFVGPEGNRWDDPKKAGDQIRKKLQAGAKGIGSVGADDFTVEQVGPAMEVAEEFDVMIQWGVRGATYAERKPEAVVKFAAAFPRVKQVIGDAGGKGFLYGGGWQAIIVAASYPNLYLEIGGGPVELIDQAVRNLGPERVLFGTDFSRPEPSPDLPPGHRDGYFHWRNLNAVALANITDAQRELILYKNAARLLKLESDS